MAPELHVLVLGSEIRLDPEHDLVEMRSALVFQ